MPLGSYENVFDLFNSSEESTKFLHEGDYTKVSYKDFNGFAPKEFVVTKKQLFKGDVELDIMLQTVKFHEGDIKDGINGLMDEDLLAMVFARLSHFQETKFNCQENFNAMAHIEAALHYMRSRTERRKQEGLEGTHQV